MTQPTSEISDRFPFSIEDGILCVWTHRGIDGDWIGRTATLDDIKNVIKYERKEAVQEAAVMLEIRDRDSKVFS